MRALRVGTREQPAATLDEAHMAVWDAIRHLFPSHAMVDQCNHGVLLISWQLPNGRRTHFAAPIMIRIEPGLLLALWATQAVERSVIARLQERTVRAALGNYDPAARVPTADVIELGSEVFA